MAARGFGNIWRCSDCSMHHVARHAIQRRAFTASAVYQKLGAVPRITNSDTNSELNEMYDTFRNKVFLPAYLPKGHRKLVFSKKGEQTLKTDTVIAEIQGEEFRLQHIDRTKDLPDKASGLFAMVDKFETPTDWSNLPALLEGLRATNWKIQPVQIEKLIRKAGLAGRMVAVIQCAKQADATGLYLKDRHIVASAMWFLSRTAAVSGWDKEVTEKSLQDAEKIVNLLEEKVHCGGNPLHMEDPRVSPDVVGTLLQLAAVRATKHYDGKDVDGRVAKYAERLRSVITNGLITAASSNVHDRGFQLGRISVILQGMRFSEKILDPTTEAAKWLKRRDTRLSDLAASEREFILQNGKPDKEYVGMWAYKTYIEAEALDKA